MIEWHYTNTTLLTYLLLSIKVPTASDPDNCSKFKIMEELHMTQDSSRDAIQELVSKAEELGLVNIVVGVNDDGEVDTMLLYGIPSTPSDVLNRTFDELVNCGFLSDAHTLSSEA